jgi:gluconate 2-dehydrogenase gamma chain
VRDDHGLEVKVSEMDRRRFLKSVAAGGTVAFGSLPAFGVSTEKSLAAGCKFLTPPQAALVEAIAEQIVPSDEFPGGKKAGVLFYMDRVLAGHFGHFYREQYERGLNMVEDASRQMFGHSFVSVQSDQQISILKALESGEAAGQPGREFFARILQHTMEGYYGDPEHGGNRNGASWKMIGFEG